MVRKNPILYCSSTQGKFVLSAGNLYRIIMHGNKTGGRFSLMEAILKPGQGAPMHIHTLEDEAFFVLEGEMTFYGENDSIKVKREGFVTFGPGEKRGFVNNGDVDARVLLFYSNAGIEEMTLRGGTLVNRDIINKTSSVKEEVQCPILAEEYGVKELK